MEGTERLWVRPDLNRVRENGEGEKDRLVLLMLGRDDLLL